MIPPRPPPPVLAAIAGPGPAEKGFFHEEFRNGGSASFFFWFGLSWRRSSPPGDHRREREMAPSEEQGAAAAKSGDRKTLTAYIESGSNINAPVDMSTGETMLHIACGAGQLQSVQLLVEAGAKLTVLDNDCQNVLHYAANEGHVSVVRYLVEQGISAKELNRLDNFQMSPLHLAVEGGHTDLVRFLTALPQMDEKIRRGSITFIAQRHEYDSIVELLTGERETVLDERGKPVEGDSGSAHSRRLQISPNELANAINRPRLRTPPTIPEPGEDEMHRRAGGSAPLSNGAGAPAAAEVHAVKGDCGPCTIS